MAANPPLCVGQGPIGPTTFPLPCKLARSCRGLRKTKPSPVAPCWHASHVCWLPCLACCADADHGELIAMSRGGIQLELRGPALRTRGNK